MSTKRRKGYAEDVDRGVSKRARNELTKLSAKTQVELLRVIARISERSYRRGAQQGHELGVPEDVVSWRYDWSLDVCPELPNAADDSSSLWRLDVEEGDALARLGLFPILATEQS